MTLILKLSTRCHWWHRFACPQWAALSELPPVSSRKMEWWVTQFYITLNEIWLYSRFSRNRHLGVPYFRLFSERGVVPCEADRRHSAIENTWRRPNQHCKFNALVARIDDHSIVFNYAVWARCHHTVLNWPAILSERFVWCLKMTFNMRYRWKRGAHARAARRRVGCTQSHKIPHKINFCVNIAVSR